MNEVKQLREALGDKSCPSPMFEKEYYLGADTGDRVCSVCGRYEFECFCQAKNGSPANFVKVIVCITLNHFLSLREGVSASDDAENRVPRFGWRTFLRAIFLIEGGMASRPNFLPETIGAKFL